MEIIPAIDLREGACARLLEPNQLAEAVRSDDPIEQAVILRSLGASWVHITDLDGAFSGHLCNQDVLRGIKERTGLKIQHHGGVRRLEHIQTLLDLGVDRVVIGTQILRDKKMCRECLEHHGDRVLPGVDGKDGMVTLEGYSMNAAESVLKLLSELREIGFQDILYTDRRRVGALKGVNIEGVTQVMSFGLGVQVAGGINSYNAILQLKEMGAKALVIGKAIYTGDLDLTEAMKLVH